MVDLRAFLDDYLCHAVVEVGVVAEADVALNDHAFRVASGYDQHSRVSGEPFLVRRHEHQVDRAFDSRALSHVNQRAIADERGVERGKAVVLDRCQSTEVPPRDHAIRLDHSGQIRDGNALALVHAGQGREVSPVDEDQRIPIVVPGHGALNGLSRGRGNRAGRGQLRPGYGRDVGVLPRLVASPSGRKAEPRKVVEAFLSKLPQPVRARCRDSRVLLGVAVVCCESLGHCLNVYLFERHQLPGNRVNSHEQAFESVRSEQRRRVLFIE